MLSILFEIKVPYLGFQNRYLVISEVQYNKPWPQSQP